MTEKEYRRSEGISRSELWRLRESPEKFKWFQEHPEPSTPALVFGAAVHKLLLEPDTFNAEFAVAPECDRRTKDGRDAYNAFLTASDGKNIISLADYEKAAEMAQKALEAPFVKKLLDGEHEKPFYWVDDLTGEACKIRVDCISTIGGKPVIVDYKTTADASTDGFTRSAVNYGYTFQSGMYLEGVCQNLYHKSILSLLGTGEAPIFVFIVQEKNTPYSVNICQADDLFVKYGYDIFRELLGLYKDCKESNNFFGYLGKYDVINNLSLPAWLAKEME